MPANGLHIVIRNVRKLYRTRRGEVEAIRSVSMEVGYGEFVSLLGPSGCGKTTLLMTVGGLLPLSEGRVEVAGEPVTRPRRDTGIVFQSPVLLPWRSVLDNVLFPVETLHLERRTYEARALELLERTGLIDFRDNYPRELSGGMRQRVAICRALVHNPAVLLMDEPFSALDALTRDDMNQELLRIWDAYRKTVLFVTHSLREAVFLSDRIYVMSVRPAVISKVVAIDLPRPRELRIQETVEFNRYVGELREAIQK